MKAATNDEVSPDGNDLVTLMALRLGIDQGGPRNLGVAQFRPLHCSQVPGALQYIIPMQIFRFKASLVQDRSAQLNSAQVSANQVNSAETSIAQISTVQVSTKQ